jgi:hypothetical protein
VLKVHGAKAMSADLAKEEFLEVQRVKRYERGGFDERLWRERLA